MRIKRPDLSQVSSEVLSYIKTLENELENLQTRLEELQESASAEKVQKTDEPPTTINVIVLTANGISKRTPRHLYTNQRRGGMGIFDLETDENTPPAILTIADISQSLLLFTNQAHAFRLPVELIPEAPVRGRGASITAKIPLSHDEHIVAALPDQAEGAVVLVSQRGMVRHLRHHIFGEYMRPGTAMFDPKRFGPLAAACYTSGNSDVFIATRKGRAIRFSETLIPPKGFLGIRTDEDDAAIAVTAVYPDSGVLLVDTPGKGTIRLMSGFRANKSAGGGGKNAMNTATLVNATAVDDSDSIFMISRLSKIIRFHAEEIPPKEGVVQGVNCMSLRADEVVAVAVSSK